ncbi:MAG: restriction endonuclease subunit S [Salinivirgaceae bacterium]
MNRITLKDCCAFQEGYVNPSQKIRDYFNGPIKWLRASDLNDGFVYNTEKTLSNKGFESAGKSAFLFNANTIAISKSGTIGRLGILKDRMCGNRAVINIDVNKQVADLFYVFYTLIYKKAEILSKAGGSIQKNLYVSALETISLNHKVLTTQKSIAKILSDLDAKIELNNRINRELEAMAKTLYDYWFVQFDFPDANGKPYKSSGGKMVYNAELKREIPEGWKNGTLGDIAELVRGVTYDASEIKDENDCDVIPVLRATNISGNVIDLNNMVFVPKQNVSTIQVLNKYDILITMSSGSREHIGKNGFFYFDKEVAFGAFCAKIVAKNKYRFYVYSYTQSDFMFSTIKNECLGTNINNLNGSLVKGFKLVIPPEKFIISFNNKVSSIYEKIGNNLIQNQQLSEIRDWLLPMLMNGQVTVKEAEEKLAIAAEPEMNYQKVRKMNSEPTRVDYYKRMLLAAEIVWQCHKESTLGHKKLQKLIYLCQHSSKMQLPTKFAKHVAGPYDGQMARSLDKKFKDKLWFEYHEGELYKYKPLKNAGSHIPDFEKYFKDELESIQEIILTFKTAKSDKVELVATLFDCWQELIDEKTVVSEEALMTKFYAWSEAKKQFSQERVKKAIAWMKEKGMNPG